MLGIDGGIGMQREAIDTEAEFAFGQMYFFTKAEPRYDAGYVVSGPIPCNCCLIARNGQPHLSPTRLNFGVIPIHACSLDSAVGTRKCSADAIISCATDMSDFIGANVSLGLFASLLLLTRNIR